MLLRQLIVGGLQLSANKPSGSNQVLRNTNAPRVANRGECCSTALTTVSVAHRSVATQRVSVQSINTGMLSCRQENFKVVLDFEATEMLLPQLRAVQTYGLLPLVSRQHGGCGSLFIGLKKPRVGKAVLYS